MDEFIALNGELDLKDYTRDHWAAWRADCLAKHGPGPTAFKRFSMMKTVCNEAIRAGLFNRKEFEGQDVAMKKPKSKKLRNEGLLADELTDFFSASVFRGAKDGPHPDADYWVAVILAYTGARLSEVTGMQVSDVAERHGMPTFFLRDVYNKRKALIDYVNRNEPPPKELNTPVITVRTLRDQIKEADLWRTVQADRDELLKAWSAVDNKYGDKLRLPILPAVNGTNRVSSSEFGRIIDNADVAEAYSVDLTKTCVKLATRGIDKEKR